MRVVFLGMLEQFSIAPLEALIAAGIEVRAVIVPADGRQRAPIAPVAPAPQHSALPIANPYLARNIASIAWERRIPVFEVGSPGHPQTREVFAGLRADVACVACFPQRIPAALLALPPLGFLNLHPALLPAYRGPAPLFWTFRNGEPATGVTVHFMDQGLDTGDIAMQAPLALPDGISGARADTLCSELGARLLVETLDALRHGTLVRRAQPAGGSYHPWPTADDFTISTDWPARRAFNFMRGTAEWGHPYRVEASGQPLALRAALSYAAEETLGAAFVRLEGEVRIQFIPGVLRAREEPDPLQV